jgi:prepilin-type N-terminal cleavage/methylation domain-containing protein
VKEQGFTLVEMLIVMALIGILLSFATLQFNQYVLKNSIESQTRTMFTDLMNARSQAFMQRTTRTVNITASQMTITDASGTTVNRTNFKNSVKMIVTTGFTFSGQGIAKDAAGTDTDRAVCVDLAGNSAAVDSVILGATMIQMGKLNGGSCSRANITLK